MESTLHQPDQPHRSHVVIQGKALEVGGEQSQTRGQVRVQMTSAISRPQHLLQRELSQKMMWAIMDVSRLFAPEQRATETVGHKERNRVIEKEP